MLASAPDRLKPLTVTFLAVPTFLVSNCPVPANDTASPEMTALPRPRLAVVLPSYTLLAAARSLTAMLRCVMVPIAPLVLVLASW